MWSNFNSCHVRGEEAQAIWVFAGGRTDQGDTSRSMWDLKQQLGTCLQGGSSQASSQGVLASKAQTPPGSDSSHQSWPVTTHCNVQVNDYSSSENLKGG